jgi:hypothetical protein
MMRGHMQNQSRMAFKFAHWLPFNFAHQLRFISAHCLGFVGASSQGPAWPRSTGESELCEISPGRRAGTCMHNPAHACTIQHMHAQSSTCMHNPADACICVHMQRRCLVSYRL